MSRRTAVVGVALVALVIAGWVFVNPGGEFGLSRFGVTTYSRIPIPGFDLQVREDGAFHAILKTHDIDAERLAWLLGPKPPEVLVIGLGWEEAAKLAAEFRPPEGTRVIAVGTGEPISTYNALKAGGTRVAIHIHSTC